ncbi:MAG: HpsJ family protein [Rivularia sp. (in: Bacteria)]|nr:HpsJ family protein [Rivularia sp. MS3]
MSNIDSDRSNKSLLAQIANLNQTTNDVSRFILGIVDSLPVIRLIGYGLLILALFDVIEMFIPARFLNPNWEFQTFGALVERVAVPLIGFAFVFIAGSNERGNKEGIILKILSWLTLLLGIIYFITVPLGVINTARIYKQQQGQITARLNQQKTAIEQVKKNLNGSINEAQMQQILAQLNGGRAPEIKSPEELQQAKQQLSDFVNKGENELEAQVQAARFNQRINLLKKSVKWNLGALVSGALFITLWRNTGWARRA